MSTADLGSLRDQHFSPSRHWAHSCQLDIHPTFGRKWETNENQHGLKATQKPCQFFFFVEALPSNTENNGSEPWISVLLRNLRCQYKTVQRNAKNLVSICFNPARVAFSAGASILVNAISAQAQPLRQLRHRVKYSGALLDSWVASGPGAFWLGL